MKLILAMFLLVAVSTVHSQLAAIGVIEFIAQIVIWFSRSLFLLACDITDSKDKGVQNALWASLKNQDNLNITSCVLGCTASVFYNSRALRKVTCDIGGDDICNVVNGCLSNITHDKCSFVASCGACIAPGVIPLLPKRIGELANKLKNMVLELLKQAGLDVETTLGNIIPGAKPIFKSLQDILSLGHILNPVATQPALGQIKNSSVPLLPDIVNIFGSLFNRKPSDAQKLATNSTGTIITISATTPTLATSRTTIKTAQAITTTLPTTTTTVPTTTATLPTTTTTVPTTTTTVPTTTTKKPNNPIANILGIFNPFKGW